MAFNFFGVYFQDINGIEYRCGFHDVHNQYMPILERRDNNNWIRVSGRGNRSAQSICRQIRSQLPLTINFPNNHTQNERMELINQIIYNMNRYVTERVNYRGAHR